MLAGVSAAFRTQRGVIYKGGLHCCLQNKAPPPPVKMHKTQTEGERSVYNQTQCLAQGDKRDHVTLPVCDNANFAGKERGGVVWEVTEVRENEVLWEG